MTTEKPHKLLLLLLSLKTQQPNSKFHHLFTRTLVTDPHNTPSYTNVPDFATLSFFLSLDRERASELSFLWSALVGRARRMPETAESQAHK
jgi:hypothetical protein